MRYLISYAFEFIGTPYKWGGSGPEGIDCSGFVQEVLMSVGIDPIGDQTAQALHDHFTQHNSELKRAPGALVFYGRGPKHISHVALMIDTERVIEAGGGGSKTKTRLDAERDQAFVRVRPFNSRQDIISIVLPKYPAWVKHG